MQITIQFEAQARRAAGVRSETVDVPASYRVSECIQKVVESHGESLQPVLLDSQGAVQTSLLIFVNDEQLVRDNDRILCDGDTLTLMTPISGG